MIEVKQLLEWGKWTIVVHKNPDTDAIVGAWQLKEFGEKKYPGISKAKCLFWSGGMENFPNGERFIAVDIGGGKFDHHPAHKFPGDCAATLMAKDLGIEEDPKLINLLGYVKQHDLNGVRSPMDLADFIRCLNQKYSQPEEVLRISFEILDALYEYAGEIPSQEDRNKTADLIESWARDKDKSVTQQILKFARGLKHGNRKPLDLTRIYYSLQKKFPEKAEEMVKELLDAKYLAQQNFFIKGKNGLQYALEHGGVTQISRGKLVVVIGPDNPECDNPEIAAFVRHSRHGLNAAVIIQQNSNGRTVILTNNRFNLREDLWRIVAAIRLEEQKQQGQEKLTIDFDKLSQSGKVFPVDNWHFQEEKHPGGGKLLNGSRTATDVPPTKIPLKRITEVVETVLRLGRNFKWQTWLFKTLAS